MTADSETAIRNVIMMAILIAWIYAWWAVKLIVRGKVIKEHYSFIIK